MLSHRAMYYGLLKGFPNLNVISEEDDPEKVDMNKFEKPNLVDPDVNKIVPDDSDVIVPIDEIDVWIDPLDATQEVCVLCINYLLRNFENVLHYRATLLIYYTYFFSIFFLCQ